MPFGIQPRGHGRRTHRRVPWQQLAVISITTALLTSCETAGVLDPQGPVSRAEKLILLNATGIMLVVVVPVILMTLAFAWWYRASNKRATRRPDFVYSGSIELVVWAIPSMVVLLLAGVAWIGAHDLDPAQSLKSHAQPLRVEVVSLDWKWLFIYPDLNLATVNELIVPAGSPIEFTLTSATVMNAFFIPQLGTQIYTMPGMSTHLNLQADTAGDYPGLSSHFSGDGFSDMQFVVHALPPEKFAEWRSQIRDAPTLSAAAYDVLAQPSERDATKTYLGIEPRLYEHILHSAAPTTASSSGSK